MLREDNTEIDIPTRSAIDDELELLLLLDDEFEDSTEVDVLFDSPTSVSLSLDMALESTRAARPGDLARGRHGWHERATRSTHRVGSWWWPRDRGGYGLR